MMHVTCATPGVTATEVANLRDANADLQTARATLRHTGAMKFNPPHDKLEQQPWCLMKGTSVARVFEDKAKFARVHEFFQWSGRGDGHNKRLYDEYVQAKADVAEKDFIVRDLMTNGAPPRRCLHPVRTCMPTALLPLNAGAMRINGCEVAHINNDTLPGLLSTGDVAVMPVPNRTDSVELVVQEGHHVMCIHPELQAQWVSRSGRKQYSLCRQRHCNVEKETGTWGVAARGAATSDVQPYDFLASEATSYSAGNMVLKCKYSTGTGKYPHAFHQRFSTFVRRPPSPPSPQQSTPLGKRESQEPDAPTTKRHKQADALKDLVSKRAAILAATT